MQAVAAPKAFGAAFWREQIKDTLFQFIYIKRRSYTDAQRLSKSFLASKALVASLPRLRDVIFLRTSLRLHAAENRGAALELWR
jgi:hypothetical protein